MSESVSDEVARRAGSPVVRIVPAGGGSIAESFRVQLVDGRTLFAKTHPSPPAGLFATEADGLRWLAECASIRVPTVIGGHEGLLIMEWVAAGDSTPLAQERLGHGLAALHRMGAPRFGRHPVGFIGDLPRNDSPCDTWAEFWSDRRLEPLVRLAVDHGAIAVEAAKLVERVSARLPDLLGPDEAPARLHGDLWSGNVIWGAGEQPWLG